MIKRRNRLGQDFYGCTSYPTCRYTEDYYEEDDDEDDNEGWDKNNVQYN